MWTIHSNKSARNMRKSTGSSILEIPVAIWLVLVVLFIPMLGLSAITLKSTLLNIAVQDAIHAAAKAKTFEQSTDEGPSATQIATDVFTQGLAQFPGLADSSSIDLDILEIGLVNQQLTRRSAKLLLPADSSQSTYQIEGTATASIDPLFPLNKEIFGSIPGLSDKMLLTFRAREMFETPQGLNR